MIELSSSKDQAKVLEAISNWEEAGVSPVLHLTIGDEDYSDRIPDGTLKHDGIAIDLEATFAGHLPLELYGAPVNLSVVVDGVSIPQLKGLVSLPEPNDDRTSTKLVAASAGSLADKYPLNERVPYSGDPPYFVVRDALRRLPYIPGGVRVENVEGPALYFADGAPEGPFEPDQTVNDILSKVGEKVPYVFRDTADGGHKAWVSAGLSKIPEVPEHMRFDAQTLQDTPALFWKSPALALEQYAQVIVSKRNQDGTDAFEPVVANVTYVGRKFPPPAGLALRIEWTGNAQGAQQHAYEKVKELARGLYKSGPILPYHPLIERTDAFIVSEVKEEENGGFYEREWLHYVDTWEHDWSEGFETKPTCPVTLADEQFVKAPTLILSLISSGAGNRKPLWGRDAQGDYIEEQVAWAYRDTSLPGSVVIDETLSGGIVTRDPTDSYWLVN